MWRGVEVRTGEERVHWDVNRDDIPVFISERWSIIRTGVTVECIPVGDSEDQKR